MQYTRMHQDINEIELDTIHPSRHCVELLRRRNTRKSAVTHGAILRQLLYVVRNHSQSYNSDALLVLLRREKQKFRVEWIRGLPLISNHIQEGAPRCAVSMRASPSLSESFLKSRQSSIYWSTSERTFVPSFSSCGIYTTRV